MQRHSIDLAAAAASWYTGRVMSEEEEDFNAFNCWDCLGASLMLAIMPAALNYIFNDKDLISSAILGVIGVGISVAVFLLAFITRWRIIGTIVNIAGCILTPIYVIIAVYCWVS